MRWPGTTSNISTRGVRDSMPVEDRENSTYQDASDQEEANFYLLQHTMGLLPNTLNCGLHMRRECRKQFSTFSLPSRVSDPDIHHGTCVAHLPWCMPGSLTSGLLWSRWRGKRYMHSRRTRNPQFCASGKRPIANMDLLWMSQFWLRWWLVAR